MTLSRSKPIIPHPCRPKKILGLLPFCLHYLLLAFETVKYLCVRELISQVMAGEMAVVCTRMGKPSLDFSGCQYEVHGKNSKLASWGAGSDRNRWPTVKNGEKVCVLSKIRTTVRRSFTSGT